MYDVIYADPPWRYRLPDARGGKVEDHYPTMADADIQAMPVRAMASDQAVLLLWATNPKLKEALAVMEAWGFDYASNAVWDKELLGIGYWFRGQHELLLVGRLPGTRATPIEHRRSSVFRERRRRHSQKPQCVRDWIEAAWPAPAPKLELFAREHWPGWDVFGNEEHQMVML